MKARLKAMEEDASKLKEAQVPTSTTSIAVALLLPDPSPGVPGSLWQRPCRVSEVSLRNRREANPATRRV